MSTKTALETELTKSQFQVIVNAWRMLDFESFFMVSVTLEPFVVDSVSDELSFLTSVKYQLKHLIDNKEIPLLSIGSNELGEPLGEVLLCKLCGETHSVLYANKIMEDGARIKSKLLAYYKCGGKEYICGFNGFTI